VIHALIGLLIVMKTKMLVYQYFLGAIQSIHLLKMSLNI